MLGKLLLLGGDRPQICIENNGPRRRGALVYRKNTAHYSGPLPVVLQR
jgi:hypothetical protein